MRKSNSSGQFFSTTIVLAHKSPSLCFFSVFKIVIKPMIPKGERSKISNKCRFIDCPNESSPRWFVKDFGCNPTIAFPRVAP